MYLISQDEPLTVNRLGKILNQFQTMDLPKLQQYYKYYKGDQKILNKCFSDQNKPCNKVVVNYCYNIVQNYLGYLTGIPLVYSNDDFEDVIDILKYNDVTNEDNEYLRQALIFGKAYEINYIDEEGKQRFRILDSRECIPIYDNTLNNDLLYVVRFYREDLIDETNTNYIVEVYSQNNIVTYKSAPGFNSFNFISQRPHYYGQVPITVFKLNEDAESIFDKVMSLQDGYNELISDEVDNVDAFADAYLVLKGCIADEEALEDMKSNRVLMMDSDASAEYLTKNITDTQITDMLENFKEQIHKISSSPDFSDEKFMAQSGIAMRYKLVGFENNASNIESNMRKALQRRIELISAILNLTDEELWRDVDIKFTRNLPLNMEELASQLNMLRGLVSNETLISQIPFVTDVQEELKKVKQQQEERTSLFNYEDDEE